MTEKINGRLENWYVCMGMVWGDLYDDPAKRWDEGTNVHTSSIEVENEETLKEGDIIKTKNSRYLLGKIFKPGSRANP